MDDEPSVRRSLERVAESRGHQVRVAEDGVEGLKMWSDSHPDLVFLDVIMPNKTGPEVLQQIEMKSSTKVILMSAHTGDYNLERAKTLGADLFISKPFENIFETMDRAEKLFES